MRSPPPHSTPLSKPLNVNSVPQWSTNKSPCVMGITPKSRTVTLPSISAENAPGSVPSHPAPGPPLGSSENSIVLKFPGSKHIGQGLRGITVVIPAPCSGPSRAPPAGSSDSLCPSSARPPGPGLSPSSQVLRLSAHPPVPMLTSPQGYHSSGAR